MNEEEVEAETRSGRAWLSSIRFQKKKKRKKCKCEENRDVYVAVSERGISLGRVH